MGDLDTLDRRRFLAGAAAARAGLAVSGALAATPPVASADAIVDATVSQLRALLDSQAFTALALARHFLERIALLDKRGPAINAVIELNPAALAIAEARDAERKAGAPLGPLHGIPILIKDNIDSADGMKTSAGSLALAGDTPARDAFIVARLRAAGAVILGKTNLSEWANFRSSHATSGWSARGGLTKNPHVLDRNPSGSSSGTGAAVAAGFAALGIGTETDGSIISPASVCGIVGIKPTVGLWSRSGIVPISASQDTAGPMARTVADAAALLGALTASDPNDAATRARGRVVALDYTRFLDDAALRGARIGVPRDLAGFNGDVDRTLGEAIDALKAAGAVIVDGLKLGPTPGLDEAESEVLLYEFKVGLAAYLAARAPAGSARTLADLIAFNQRERLREMPWFGQDLFEKAQKKGPLSDAGYRAARARCVELTRTNGLDAFFAKHRLNALICPSNAPAWLSDLLNGDHFTGGNTTFAAVSGYPSITVPMGRAHGLPLGLSFVGPAWTEARLIGLAYAFERQTSARRAPRFLSSIEA